MNMKMKEYSVFHVSVYETLGILLLEDRVITS